jgi:hypothetical protein
MGILNSSRYEVVSGDASEPTGKSSDRYEVIPEGSAGTSSSNPIDENPDGLTAGDRAKLAFMDSTNKISYLKQKFDDASVNEVGDVVITNKGQTYKLDPSRLEIRDLAELGPEFVQTAASVVGTVAGSAIGSVIPGPGTMVGASLGSGTGSAAAGWINNRIAEHYGSKTPETEVKDLAMDFTIGLAGPLIIPGGKYIAGNLPKTAAVKYVMEGVEKVAAKAVPESKQILSQFLSKISSQPIETTDALLNKTKIVGREMTSSLESQGNEVNAVMQQTERALKNTARFAEGAQPALTQKYNELVNAMSKVAGKFSFSTSSALRDATVELEKRGINKSTQNQFLQALGGPGVPNEIKESFNVIKSLAGSSSTPSGKRAVDVSLKLRSTVNQLNRNLDGMPPELRQFVEKYTQEISKQISRRYDTAKLYEPFQKATGLYEKYADAVHYVSKADPKKLSELMVVKTGNNLTNPVDLVTQLQGGRGEALRDIVRVHTAAANLIPKMPVLKSEASKLSASGIALATITGHNPLGVIGTAALATQRSPRLLAREVQYASQVGPFLGKMVQFTQDNTPETLTKLLRNPQALQQVIQTGLQASEEKEQLHEKLVNGQ